MKYNKLHVIIEGQSKLYDIMWLSNEVYFYAFALLLLFSLFYANI